MDTLTKPSEIPTSKRSSRDSLLWVVDAGCVTMVLVSPRLDVNEHNLTAFKKFRPASTPPLISKANILPPWLICFLAISYCGCDFKKGYLTKFTLGCPSKNVATFKALSQ